MSNGIRHGHPEVTRNDKWEHDKYVWPGGLELSTTTPRAGLSGPMDGSKRGLPNACHDDRSSTRDLKKETPVKYPTRYSTDELRAELETFLDQMGAEHKKDETISTRKSHVSVFLRWLDGDYDGRKHRNIADLIAEFSDETGPTR
jgi:hypothetical protein